MDKKNWFKEHKILTGIIIFICLALIGGILEESEVSNNKLLNSEVNLNNHNLDEVIVPKENIKTEYVILGPLISNITEGMIAKTQYKLIESAGGGISYEYYLTINILEGNNNEDALAYYTDKTDEIKNNRGYSLVEYNPGFDNCFSYKIEGESQKAYCLKDNYVFYFSFNNKLNDVIVAQINHLNGLSR